MADGTSGADSLRKAGLGFFDKTGELKSKEALSSESKKAGAAASSAASVEASDSAEFTTKVTESFGSVGREFRSDANEAISTLNQTDDDLKKAARVVKDELKTARDLKKAIKEGDDGRAEKLREKLTDIRGKRDEVAKTVESNNRERAADKNQVVTFGNQPVATVKINDVKFSAPSEEDLKTAKGVDKYIEDLQDDRKAIVGQRKELRETRQELKSTIDVVEGQLSKLRDDTVRSYDDAASLANNLAGRIKSGGQEALAVNVNESVVKALFQ